MVDLSSLGAQTSGVWTRPQALRLLRRGQIDELVRSGTWQVLWRGVYADSGIVPSPEQRGIAAVLAAGGADQPRTAADGSGRKVLRAVAVGRTAARAWGLPLIDDDDPATEAAEHLLDDVGVGRRLPVQAYGGRTLRPTTAPLRGSDVMRTPGGLWVTRPARTLLDCARLLSHEALVCAVDSALHRGADAAELAAQAGRARQPGAPALRAALAVADSRAESPAETLARLLLLPVLPELVPQVQLFDRAARLVARFDLGDPSVQLAVEADGRRGHAGRQMVAKDRRRDRRTEAYGWATERVTWFELRCQQAALLARVVQRHAELVALAGPRAATRVSA